MTSGFPSLPSSALAGDSIPEAAPDLPRRPEREDLLNANADRRVALEMAGVPARPAAANPVQENAPAPQARAAAAGNTGSGGGGGVISGARGRTFLNNADIQSQASGNYDPYPGDGPRGPPAARPGGDVIAAAKASHNDTTDTLRPQFPIAPPSLLQQTPTQQVFNDIGFDIFSKVLPGSGLGVTNKMFEMNQLREKHIHFMEPMDLPRKDEGPTGLVLPPPLELQNVVTHTDREALKNRQVALDLSAALTELRAGASSSNILGHDFGELAAMSAKGLKRDAESPLEPIIRMPNPMTQTALPSGHTLSYRKSRRLFDGLRYPERFDSHPAQSGGPTMSTRNSLALMPFIVSA